MTSRTHLRVLFQRAMLLGILLTSCALPVLAQNNTEGSIYSRYGIGELRAFPSAQIQAMGGGATALPSLYYLNTSNPASWSDQVLTRASAGVFYQGLQATDASDDVSELAEGGLSAIKFSFPIITRKLGAAVAYEPFSRVSYAVQRQGAIEADPVLGDTNVYNIRYEGGGGLQQVTAGAGYRINEQFSVGVSGQFIFGVLEDIRRTSFEGRTFSEAYLINSTRLNGFSGTLGANLSLPNLARDGDYLHVGASFTLPTTLNGSRTRMLGPTEGLRDTLRSEPDGSVSLPLMARLGAAYMPDARWTLVADAEYAPWSAMDKDAFVLARDQFDYNDRIRASAGFEFLPAGTDLQDPFLKRVAYRLGAYFEQSYVSPYTVPVAGGAMVPSSKSPNTFALTTGLGLPALFPGTRIDIGFEVGRRGTTDAQLVRDTFYRFSATVNFGERWFEKRKLR